MSDEFINNERPQRNRPGRSSAWIPGLIMIALGVFFLAENFGFLDVFERYFNMFNFNWWAFFILIPIVSIASKLVQEFNANGGALTKDMQGQLGGLLVMLVVFFALLLNWDWSFIWPLILIAIGLNILVPKLMGKDDEGLL